MALLEIDDVRLHFGGLTVLANLSFVVEEGSIASLIGPNGAGKTSAFNCVTGFYRIDGGDIRFLGRSIRRLAPHRITRLGMARTFQNLRLFHSMSVLENVMSGMHCRTRAGALGAIFRSPSQRAEEREVLRESERCLAFVGISEHRGRLAQNLPYGDQRRVEWARALATQPKLLLLDEPGAGLNAEEKDALVTLIRRVRDELGISVLLIEHDMGLVMKVSEHITVLDYGQKIAQGSPDEVQNDPTVVEAYLGREDEEAA